MSRSVGLCGIGHPLIDYILRVSDEELSQLNLLKGSSQLMESDTEERIRELLPLLERRGAGKPERRGGGSLANSLFAFGQLGGRVTLLGSLGDDDDGNYYRQECELYNITCPVAPNREYPTGRCTALITPDGERTQRAALGSAVTISASDFDDRSLQEAEWVALEGYLVENGERGRQAIDHVIRVAKGAGTKIVLTLSDSWLLDLHRSFFHDRIKDAALVVGNEGEFCTLFEVGSFPAAVEASKEKGLHVAITRGAQGAYLRVNGEEAEVSSPVVQVADLIGAGDMFLGTLLFGLQQSLSLSTAGRKACALASQVIQVPGARLPGSLRSIWNEV
jgi:sugar/nucleoside kinase (ribokinase family)